MHPNCIEYIQSRLDEDRGLDVVRTMLLRWRALYLAMKGKWAEALKPAWEAYERIERMKNNQHMFDYLVSSLLQVLLEVDRFYQVQNWNPNGKCWAMRLCSYGLVAQSTEMEVTHDIARSWEILDCGEQYVFHLRDDVFWSDGKVVTAEDFEFTFKLGTRKVDAPRALFSLPWGLRWQRGQVRLELNVQPVEHGEMYLADKLDVISYPFSFSLCGIVWQQQHFENPALSFQPGFGLLNYKSRV